MACMPGICLTKHNNGSSVCCCRRPYERLLRKALSLPNNPAVLLMHSYAWFKPEPHLGNFYSNAERDFNELAEYYGLPAVSVKSCCHEAMRNAEPGFQVRELDLTGSASGGTCQALTYTQCVDNGNVCRCGCLC
jgi:hypothetical protein